MSTFQPVQRFFWEGVSIPGWREPRRRLYDCEFVYLSHGSFTLAVAGRAWALKAGAVALVPPATWHESWTRAGESAMRHCIHFDWTPAQRLHRPPLQAFWGEPFERKQVHNLPARVAAALPHISMVQSHPGLAHVVEALLVLMREQAPLADPVLGVVLSHLLATDAATDPPAMTDRRRTALWELKQFIDTRYAQPLGYADFQRVTRLSASHVCRAFTAWLGRTPTAYLNDLRLQHAHHLLRDSSLSVKEVAAAVGIPDPNYFARQFRRKFGTVPSNVTRP